MPREPARFVGVRGTRSTAARTGTGTLVVVEHRQGPGDDAGTQDSDLVRDASAVPADQDPADSAPAHDVGRDTAASGVERELVMMFRRARKLSLSVASEVHPDLDPASYSLLLMIDDAGSLRGMDVADRAGLDKSTVSRQIATLVGLDLLERVPDPDDGRARLVQLSEAGRSRLEAVRERRSERLREVFAQWSTSDLHELARLLGKLNGMY